MLIEFSKQIATLIALGLFVAMIFVMSIIAGEKDRPQRATSVHYITEAP